MDDLFNTATIVNGVLTLISVVFVGILIVRGIRASGYKLPDLKIPRRHANSSAHTPSPSSHAGHGNHGNQRKIITWIAILAVIALVIYFWRTSDPVPAAEVAERTSVSYAVSEMPPGRLVTCPSTESGKFSSPALTRVPGFKTCVAAPPGSFIEQTGTDGNRYQCVGGERELKIVFRPTDTPCP